MGISLYMGDVMTALAEKLKQINASDLKSKPEPTGSCFPLYGYGDHDDRKSLDRLREDGLSWGEAQNLVDSILGIENPIPLRRFKHHWSAGCGCWA